MGMMISAADLIALYLGLELMSLSLYVVAASNRDSVRSTEAGLKYFVLGALSSGMLLYGCSLIYGFTGTVSFAGIAKATQGGAGIGLIFGLVFLFAGLCFKVSAVPFHMWTPDVYEGAPTPVTAFFAAAPKIAAIALFIRVAIERIPRHRAAMAADPGVRRHRLHAARRLRRDRAAQHQTSDGLFFDRPHGLRTDRPRRRQPRGRAGRPDLHDDLSRDDARHLLLHPGDAPGRRRGREYFRSRGPRAHQSGAGVLPGDAAVLARRHSAARRLLREVLCVPCRHEGRAVHARGDRRARQRGRRLLLPDDHQDDVLRRAGARASSRCRSSSRPCSASPACSIFCFSSIPHRSSKPQARRRNRCSDDNNHRPDQGGHSRDDRLDQRRGADARPQRRARAAVGHRQAADRGTRPARPPVGVGAGQSLRHAAADRRVRRRSARRSCRSSRRWRFTTRSPGAFQGSRNGSR